MKISIVFGLVAQLCFVLGTPTNPDETSFEHHVHPKHGASWKGRISHSQHSRFQKMRFGVRLEPIEQRFGRPFVHHLAENTTLPKSFDARKKWGNRFHLFGHCKHIGTIRDQSNCGASWIFAAVQAIGDRMCIHSNYKFNELLSANHLLSCCTSCGSGCDGDGSAITAWNYWVRHGITTEKCQPYPFPSCDHHVRHINPPCNGIPFDTPICDDQCKSSRYSMKQQITHGHEAYYLKADEKQIMYELMTRGPLEMVMNVYEDFLTYESGVYFNAFGNELGKHAVRLIGWGEEKGTRYWTLANSWNENWGEKGFFRIVRGWNECQIESDVTAGMPRPF